MFRVVGKFRGKFRKAGAGRFNILESFFVLSQVVLQQGSVSLSPGPIEPDLWLVATLSSNVEIERDRILALLALQFMKPRQTCSRAILGFENAGKCLRAPGNWLCPVFSCRACWARVFAQPVPTRCAALFVKGASEVQSGRRALTTQMPRVHLGPFAQADGRA